MHGCMNALVYDEWMHGCVMNECMGTLMNGCLGAWVHDEWMHGCMDERISHTHPHPPLARGSLTEYAIFSSPAPNMRALLKSLTMLLSFQSSLTLALLQQLYFWAAVGKVLVGVCLRA